MNKYFLAHQKAIIIIFIRFPSSRKTIISFVKKIIRSIDFRKKGLFILGTTEVGEILVDVFV